MHRWTMISIVALAATPLRAEVVETSADGFVTRDTATVAASPMETWLALTKPGEWWNSSHTWSGDAANLTLTPQAGGCFCERIPGDDGAGGSPMEGSARHAVVVQAFPLKVLRMRGGLGPLQGEPATGVLTITLKDVDGGTRILWEYNVGGPMRYEIPQISKAVDAVMSEQLRGLQAHLGSLDAPTTNEEPGADTPG
ncbi:SRPBCC family protein [Qipengyuania sp.]|uniref:SRPBCC family protein n=1 Tax=Qipengyuania sp. TaxID=2004515 RepID=UPI0035C81B5E